MSESSQLKSRLIEVLKRRSVRWGEFTLASGKTSDLYVDARLTSLSPDGAPLIGEILSTTLADDVVAIGGPVTGADPIVGAAIVSAASRGRDLYGFMVRKQAKAHGRGRVVEGADNLTAGAKVVVVEDTVTTGGSLLRALEHVEAAGLVVDEVVVVVDREEGAAERIIEAGYRFRALVGRSDLLDPSH
jgi:orotate phosphoribosyltransferase